MTVFVKMQACISYCSKVGMRLVTAPLVPASIVGLSTGSYQELQRQI